MLIFGNAYCIDCEVFPYIGTLHLWEHLSACWILWYDTARLWFWYWCKIITLMLGIKWVTHKRTHVACGFVWLDSEVTLLQWRVLHWVGIPVQRTNLLAQSHGTYTIIKILRNQKFPKFINMINTNNKTNQYIQHQSANTIFSKISFKKQHILKTQRKWVWDI